MTRNILLFCAALAAAGAARAQLPGLPGVALPGLPQASAPAPIPRAPERPGIPRLPATSPVLTPPPPVAPPPLARDPLGAVPRSLDAADGLAGEANAALGLADPVDDLLAEALPAVSYRERADDLLRRHPRALEADADGRPVVRGEVVAIGVSADALARARKAGFGVGRMQSIEGLDLATAVLTPPRGMAVRDALQRLRALDPAGRYDLNHIYVESGGAAAGRGAAAASTPMARGLRIGLVDGTVLQRHPVLRGAPVTQRPFAPGGAKVTAHATAVASLLAGSGPGFRGAAPGAGLYVADVYGTTPQGGSALAVARGLGWLVQERTPVIDISLVGPSNALLQAAVAAAIARGHIVVAAAGNDGPAAPPLYPAAYPGVVAVAGVDARRRPLPESGRGAHVAFAAPGADLLAASLDGGVAPVRGTSFAAPLAAGRLARLLPSPDPAAANRAVAMLSREAIDAGAPGRDPVFGRGLVGLDDAVRPATATAGR
jgi:hypothetical protein